MVDDPQNRWLWMKFEKKIEPKSFIQWKKTLELELLLGVYTYFKFHEHLLSTIVLETWIQWHFQHKDIFHHDKHTQHCWERNAFLWVQQFFNLLPYLFTKVHFINTWQLAALILNIHFPPFFSTTPTKRYKMQPVKYES